MRNNFRPPVVLIIAGNDPCGGAGLAADIQAVTAFAAHPAPVIAALTVQDTVNVVRMEALPAERVLEQARCVLADMPVAAVKLGLLGDAAVAAAVATLLRELHTLPLVVDPVLAAGGGTDFADEALLQVYREQLLPLATVVTPNGAESRRLAPAAGDTAARAGTLLATGAVHVLIKGADEHTPEVHNSLFNRDGTREDFTWPRLPGQHHGSGCTLASAIAALLAAGEAPQTAVSRAQRYTWETLKAGWQLGRGQRIPNRRGNP